VDTPTFPLSPHMMPTCKPKTFFSNRNHDRCTLPTLNTPIKMQSHSITRVLQPKNFWSTAKGLKNSQNTPTDLPSSVPFTTAKDMGGKTKFTTLHDDTRHGTKLVHQFSKVEKHINVGSPPSDNVSNFGVWKIIIGFDMGFVNGSAMLIPVGT
jgi:hypothetical protein